MTKLIQLFNRDLLPLEIISIEAKTNKEALYLLQKKVTEKADLYLQHQGPREPTCYAQILKPDQKTLVGRRRKLINPSWRF